MIDTRNGVMIGLNMNQLDYEEYRKSFIEERLSILNRKGELLPDDEAMRVANECWERYRRANKIYANEQMTYETKER